MTVCIVPNSGFDCNDVFHIKGRFKEGMKSDDVVKEREGCEIQGARQVRASEGGRLERRET